MHVSALPRTYLYVPADREDRLARAHERGADAIIADLEDGVAPGDKDLAATVLAAWLDDRPAADRAPAETWVRIDPSRRDEGLAVATHPAVTGIVLPKAESRAQLESLVATLDALERARGLAPLAIAPLVESAEGIGRLDELAGSPRVRHLGMGEADLCGELGLEADAEGTVLAPARWAVVLASARAGLARPVASTSTEFRDLEALARSTAHLRALGFRARTAIHPAQVPVINAAFTPTADEVARAREMLTVAEATGGGAAVGTDGRMVDEAVLRSARDVLARARPA